MMMSASAGVSRDVIQLKASIFSLGVDSIIATMFCNICDTVHVWELDINNTIYHDSLD